jgi:hypothetical protein
VTVIAESAAGTARTRNAWWSFIAVIIAKCKRNGPETGPFFTKNDASLWLEQQFDKGLKERRRVTLSPMTATATPVSAATEHEHYQNDNQDQFHGISPLTGRHNWPRTAYLSFQRSLQSIVPDNVQLHCAV